MMTIEQQALALVNEVYETSWLPHEVGSIPSFLALCTALERHEAFRQEVSEAVKGVCDQLAALDPSPRWEVAERLTPLSRFIIAPPVDPRKLAIREGVDEWQRASGGSGDVDIFVEAALAKHGLAITGVE